MPRRRLERRAQAPVAKAKPRRPSLTATLAFGAITLYLGWTVANSGIQEWRLYQQACVLEKERAHVLAQAAELDAQIAASRTNAGIERLAREQLGLVKGTEIPVKTAQPAVVVVAQAPRQQAGMQPALAALVRWFAPLGPGY